MNERIEEREVDLTAYTPAQTFRYALTLVGYAQKATTIDSGRALKVGTALSEPSRNDPVRSSMCCQQNGDRSEKHLRQAER